MPSLFKKSQNSKMERNGKKEKEKEMKIKKRRSPIKRKGLPRNEENKSGVK